MFVKNMLEAIIMSTHSFNSLFVLIKCAIQMIFHNHILNFSFVITNNVLIMPAGIHIKFNSEGLMEVFSSNYSQ